MNSFGLKTPKNRPPIYLFDSKQNGGKCTRHENMHYWRRFVAHVSRFTRSETHIYVGMGGLTCALALAKAGFQIIEVYELASNLGFVGAGIQLAPNMVRILDRLGVWKDIEREAVVLNETSVRRMSLESKYIIETDFYRGGDQ